VNPAEDNAAANNPSSKALSAIVSTVSVDGDALEGESVAVSPDGKLDFLGISERRDSCVWDEALKFCEIRLVKASPSVIT